MNENAVVANNSNFSSDLTTKEYKIILNITEKAFAGLSRQGMLCHQGICELCDDAISAALPGQKAQICIALAPDSDKNYIQLAVADWGTGMNLMELTNALQLGSMPTNNNRLNEHGYGLNNALACLSGGSENWSIYTRNKPGAYYKVCGPFALNMTVSTVDQIDLPKELHLQWADPSTVIYVKVPITIARTLQRRGTRKLSDLSTLRLWLLEHLGVAYRGYLELDPITLEPSAKIAITIGHNSVLVPPVSVPMMMACEEKFEIELGGDLVSLVYIHGSMDQQKRDSLIQGDKCRYYYQGTQPTQGIDIRLGKRVIATAQLSEIWTREDGTPLSRHNTYNDFLGELIIPELPRGVLSTLNNKTGIDRNDSDWDSIFELLASFPPRKNASLVSEKELQKRRMNILKAANPEDTVTSEISIWPTGTRIDILDSNDSGKLDIYELKIGKGEPQHLYQLRMYWDGLVLEGIQPTRGILIASEYANHLHEMLRILNELPPPCFPDGKPSLPYNFFLSTHAEKQLI